MGANSSGRTASSTTPSSGTSDVQLSDVRHAAAADVDSMEHSRISISVPSWSH